MHHQFFSNTFEPGVNQAIGDFVSEQLYGKAGRYDKYCSMGVFGGDLLCGVLYHNFMPEYGTIEISAASVSRRWMSKSVLRDMLNMPFERLGCQVIIARHDEQAKHLRRMWTAVGATEYIIPRLRGREKGEAVSILTSEAWASNVRSKELVHG